MKHYPKKYANLCHHKGEKKILTLLSADGITLEELGVRFNNFYRETFKELWRINICQIWLEQKLNFKGGKRDLATRHSLPMGPVIAAFFGDYVGISSSLITGNKLSHVIISYFLEFYPDFLYHDPFLDPDYYKFPYKNITLDHLCFVYQVENRIEMLERAEKEEMSFKSFANWVVNWVLCYNDDIGEEVYTVRRLPDNSKYIKNLKRKKKWRTF